MMQRFAIYLNLILAMQLVADELPVGDPAEPYYQNQIPGLPIAPGVRLGGTWVQRTPPAPAKESSDEFDTRLNREDEIFDRKWKRLQKRIGWIAKWIALAVFVAGAYCHLESIKTWGHSIGSSIMSIGGFIYVFAALMHFEARAADWIELAIVIPVAIIIGIWLYKRRDKTFLRKQPPAPAKPVYAPFPPKSTHRQQEGYRNVRQRQRTPSH